jgi:hypothetical protein
MAMKMSKKAAVAAAVLLAAVASMHAHAQVRVTEVAPWASGNAPYASDWFELTNVGALAVSIAGWKMDDSSAAFATAVALTGITSIAAGESVLFIESAAANAGFLTAWFGAAAPALQIGNYTGAGVGLSTGGDGVTIFDGAGLPRASVSFGASDSVAPYQSFDNAARLDGVTLAQFSVAGMNGAFVAAGDAGEIGSPGSAALTVSAVPETDTYLLLLAGLGALAFMSRKRRS